MISKVEKNIKGFLFDLDGTFYVSNKIIKSANKTIKWLDENNIDYVFLTNTTTKSRETLCKHLNKIGLKINKKKIITANYAGSLFLENHPNSTYELILNDEAKKDYKKSRINKNDPDFIVIGDIDNNWDFQIMNDIFNKVMDGSKIIALHRGKYFQINSGLRIDTGAFIKGLEYATNKDSILIGKPDQSFFKIALKFLNMSRKNVAMVGDDLVNDIQGAKDNNIFSILVKTGKYRENIYKSSSIEADLVINSIYEIPEFFNHLNKIETRKS